MKRSIRPSPSMLIALLALFAAFGGTSYAAAKVGSKQIRNNAVRSVDVRNKTLTGKDIKPNALGGAQVDESKLGKVGSAGNADSVQTAGSAQTATNAQKAAAADNATDAQSAGNAQNATNAGSADNAAKLGGQSPGALTQGLVYVTENTLLDSDDSKSIGVNCPPGTNVIAGGVDLSGADSDDIAVTDTTAVGDAGWQASAVEANATADNWRLRVEATCAVI